MTTTAKPTKPTMPTKPAELYERIQARDERINTQSARIRTLLFEVWDLHCELHALEDRCRELMAIAAVSAEEMAHAEVTP